MKVATDVGVQSLRQRAEFTTNEHLKGVVRPGTDLIAREAEYHKSCRIEFNNASTPKLAKHTEQNYGPSHFHKKTFEILCSYIETEVIHKQRSVLVTYLLEIYKEAYTNHGGGEANVVSYQIQSLLRKVRDHYKERI